MEKEQSTITTKAQAAALKAFPAPYFIHDRCVFRMGYEQAEKDLALTWEDMRKIICIDIEMIDDPEAHPEWMEEQPFYEEMLKRFKEARK